jgi:MFS family permease
VQIDLAFLIAAIVATIVVLITGDSTHGLRIAWRVCLGIGIIPPLSLLYLRLKLQEPEAFKRESLAKAKTPWLLVLKFYWKRLSIVSVIWFIYDFSAYSFGIYSTSILANLLGTSAPLWKSLAWNILINFFYMPGCLAGAFVADLPSMGPKKTLFIGVAAQGVIGFVMAGCYPWLRRPENVAGFVVVYGVFLALGEFGPGDNIGLIASKTCATGIRYISPSLPSFLSFSLLSLLWELMLTTHFQRPVLRPRRRLWQNRRLRRLVCTRRDSESSRRRRDCGGKEPVLRGVQSGLSSCGLGPVVAAYWPGYD